MPIGKRNNKVETDINESSDFQLFSIEVLSIGQMEGFTKL